MLTRQPDVVAVHVTSPDYYGYRLPLEDIAALCHRHGVPLIVDEAHGAHLYFLPGQPTALTAGADLVIHSPHKSLGSLTQSALLHARGTLVDHDRVAEALVLLQSSSPSSLLTMSLDAVLEDLQHTGPAVWSERAAWADEVRARRVDGRPLFVDHAAFPRGISAADPCKLLVSQPAWVDRLTELRAALLSGYGIRPEFGDHRTLVFSVVRGTTRADLDTLAAALTELLVAHPGTGRPGTTVDRWPADSPEQGCEPRLAMQAPRQVVPLDAAAGRIAARAVTPYPPGVPLLLPGELISATTLAVLRRLLANGAVVRGLVITDSDTGLFCLEPPPDPPTFDPTNTGAPQMTQADR